MDQTPSGHLFSPVVPETVFDFTGRCDQRGYITHADARFAGVVGLPVDKLIGTRALDLIHPDDRHHAAQAWESSCVDPGPSCLFRCRFTRGGEPTDWYEIVGRNFLKRDADPTFYLMGNQLSIYQALDMDRDRSAALLETLIDTIPNLVYIQNVETQRLTFVNSRSKDVLGVPADQLRQIPAEILYSFLHRDDFIPAEEYFRKMSELPAQGVFEHRARVRHGDGCFRWIKFRDAVLTRGADGKPNRILGTMEDIHDQTLQQQSLASSERRYRKLIENAYGGTTLINRDGLIEYESPANFHQTGPVPWKTTPVWEKIHPDDLAAVFAHRDEILSTPGSRLSDQSIRAVDEQGRVFWFEIRAVNLLDDPDVRAIVVNWHDITERKLAENALRRSEERLRLTQEIARTGGWEWNILTGEVWWAPQTYAIFGVDPKTFVPSKQSFFDFVHPEDIDHVRATLESAIQAQDALKFQYRIRRLDGSICWLEDVFHTECDFQGSAAYVRGSVRDITEDVRAAHERAKFEESMRQGQKLESLGVLAGGIAHDFNNLLTVILSSVELAADDPDTINTHLDRARSATLRAAELCRQLLAYAGRGKREVKAVDLNAIVREMAVLLQATVSKRATLHIDLEHEPLAVDGDGGQLVQIVMNLITNASEAIGNRPGDVWVKTSRQTDPEPDGLYHYPPGPIPPGPMAVLEVRDNGSGIHPTEFSRIFDPFFTTKFSGRGLGLAAVAGIVRSHQGYVTVESILGAGTVFRVHLPKSSSPLSSLPGNSARPSSTKLHTILIVDDQDEVRQVLTSIFESAGYQVLSASSGDEGLAFFRQTPHLDAALLDLTMPGRGGLEILADLRGINPSLPVVLMSGFPEEEVLAKASTFEFGVLQKPFAPAEVLDKVLHEIDRAQACS
jgi:PAS domain S-box-containing protein